MTWGPGQRTALHDHSGIWCVEGVMEGEMEVTRYRAGRPKRARSFASRSADGSGAAQARPGALIPPFEHHVLANDRPNRTSLTLHVYGGEMDHCSVFEPVEPVAGQDQSGLYRRTTKGLTYSE